MTDEQDKVWETIYSIARIMALRANRMHRGLVTTDDVYQHLSLWALEHWHKIEEWNQDESLKFKLRKTFYNEAQKYVAKERSRVSRTPMNDSFFYSHELLHELLANVWTINGWLSTPDASMDFVSESKKPSEGGNRLAMLSDVKHAIECLNKQDQELLRLRYADGGMEFAALAESYSVSEDAIRKRVKRALNKLQDRLGGEAPIWYGRRRVRSNAESRQEITRQENEQL